MTDLKPCPFCGGEAATEKRHNRYTDWWEVKCTDCNASLNERYEYEFEAVAEWNTRKPEEAVVAAIKEKHCKKCRNILGIAGAEEYCKEQKCEIEGVCEIVRNGGKE